jgi:hypothetical protein
LWAGVNLPLTRGVTALDRAWSSLKATLLTELTLRGWLKGSAQLSADLLGGGLTAPLLAALKGTHPVRAHTLKWSTVLITHLTEPTTDGRLHATYA